MAAKQPLSEDEKWQAVVNCAPDSDALFLYGVRTTGIFCRPSCRAKTPARENVLFFANAEEALRAGFRPCKKCRPDQATFQPDLDMVMKAIEYIGKEFKSANPGAVARRLGVSPGHLARLFKKKMHTSVSTHITVQRIKHAQKLLREAEASCTDIAYAVGFNSLSAFYAAFRRQTGGTPNQYRSTRD